MKKLNSYYKISIICALLLAVLVACQVFLVLMPVYGLVGQDVLAADAVLQKADRTAHILNVLMVATVVVMLVSAILGARKNTGSLRLRAKREVTPKSSKPSL